MEAKTVVPASNGLVDPSSDPCRLVHSTKFLDKAGIKFEDGSNGKESPWRLCQCHSSGASEDTDLSISHFCLHHSFQLHLRLNSRHSSFQQGSAMDTQLTKSFHIPSSFTSIHPLLHTHLCSPSYMKLSLYLLQEKSLVMNQE
ncbi:hypothetical protein NC651_012017 [Populus alba x Populus x berolinensis]|nr:hypothetical protein NC651_012017 [Populus alba x Populus x berolinensis]